MYLHDPVVIMNYLFVLTMSEARRKTLRTSQRNYVYARDYATNNTFLAVIGTCHMPHECTLYDSVVTMYYLFVLLRSVGVVRLECL